MNPYFRKVLLRTKTFHGHIGNADQRHVGSRSEDSRLSKRNCIGLRWHVALLKVDQPVLNEHHRIVVANAGRERALRVIRSAGSHDL